MADEEEQLEILPCDKIKNELFEDSYADYVQPNFGSDFLSYDLIHSTTTKQSSSPAQEATKTRISTCEAQLRKLYRLRCAGKLTSKGVSQIRCVEEELRKAQSKLRRLLNEAERQRRRRERLRRGVKSASSRPRIFMVAKSKTVDSEHGYSCLPPIRTYGSEHRPFVTPRSAVSSSGTSAALKDGESFQDFVKELDVLGYTISPKKEFDQTVYNAHDDSDNGDDGEVQVQVELIEGDEALEHSISIENTDGPKIKTEKITPPSSPISSTSHQEDTPPEIINADEEPPPAKQPKKSSPVPSEIKTFASEIAKKHSIHVREMQDQYITWYERQVEAQQQWEESFVREQMDLAKSMLESVTSTFLQGMQQILQSIVSNAGQRAITPLLPNYPRPDLNGIVDMPMFFNSNLPEHGNGYVSENSTSQEK